VGLCKGGIKEGDFVHRNLDIDVYLLYSKWCHKIAEVLHPKIMEKPLMSDNIPKPYPHYEIRVKDASIYNAEYIEDLPVYRPVFVIAGEKGEKGVPIWCPSFDYAKTHYGNILNPNGKTNARNLPLSNYFAVDALRTGRGAFLIRAVADDATKSFVRLNMKVERTLIPEYEYNYDGERVSGYDALGNFYYEFVYGETEAQKLSSAELDAIIAMINETLSGSDQIVKEGEGANAAYPASVFPKFTSRVVIPKNATGDLAQLANSNYDTIITVLDNTGTYKKVKMIDGLSVSFFTQTKDDVDALNESTVGRIRVEKDGDNNETWTIPIIQLAASYEGAAGNDISFSLFYDQSDSNNSKANIDYYASLNYCIQFLKRDETTDIVEPINDIYSKGVNSFAANPNSIDQSIAVRLGAASAALNRGFENTITRAYDSDNVDLPVDIIYFDENLKAAGNLILFYELSKKTDGTWSMLQAGQEGYDEALNRIMVNVDEVLKSEARTKIEAFLNDTSRSSGNATNEDEQLLKSFKSGYKINALAGVNPARVRYRATEIDDGYADDDEDNIIPLNVDYHIYMTGGNDGTQVKVGESTKTVHNLDQLIQYRFNQLLRKKMPADGSIIDKFRYPITHIPDVGWSMSTKLNMIDFLNIRDDVAISLSTQELIRDIDDARCDFDGDGVDLSITQNMQSDDEANGEVLRYYALLQKECLLYGTECCRAAIYTQSGKPRDTAMNRIVPFTYWDAHVHSRFCKFSFLSKEEPCGKPYSENDLFDINTVTWFNFDPDGQNRVWEHGMNYCQFMSRTGIGYPALRSVYQAETSVLVDQWFVDAVVYTKHEIRQTWARFTGRHDKSAVLQSAIRSDLTARLVRMLNGHYSAAVAVYQTEEERKLGYVQHIKVRLEAPAMHRVEVVDIECHREGYEAEEA